MPWFVRAPRPPAWRVGLYLVLALAVLVGPLANAFTVSASRFEGTAANKLAPIIALTLQATNPFTGTMTVARTVVFEPAGPMSVVRSHHTATLLPNGKVLVAGGCCVGTYEGLDSAELFDPASGTFSPTGNLTTGRARHTATLLPNGKVLITGGRLESRWETTVHASAELYDPASGVFTATGSMILPRQNHTATLLDDGTVLIVGGALEEEFLPEVRAELYDPATGTFTAISDTIRTLSDHTATKLSDGSVLIAGGFNGWQATNTDETSLYDPPSQTFTDTGDMTTERGGHAALRLPDGRVLITGGQPTWEDEQLRSVELYDPPTESFIEAGEMAVSRAYHTMTLLPNGLVLIAGGGQVYRTSARQSVELYDPQTGDFAHAGRLATRRGDHTATLLPDGRVLVAGGEREYGESIADGEIGTYREANVFTGSLSLPDGWINSPSVAVSFSGTAAAAGVEAGALSNHGESDGSWIAMTNGETVTSTWSFAQDGASRRVYLHLRDVNGQVARVVTGTVDVDLTAPTSTMAAVPAFASGEIALHWSGSDQTSGLGSYDVEVHVGAASAWTRVLTETTATSTTYTGTNGTTYYFRVRAHDVAGNVEAWPQSYDAKTTVDTQAPDGTLTINGNAEATTSPEVTLTLSPSAATNLAIATGASPITEMRFSTDGASWGDWRLYASTASYTLPSGDGTKQVFGQLRDSVGNVSGAISDSIRLDTAAGIERVISINAGADWSNSTEVTLTIGAPAGTTQMQLSNDGGFAGAVWQRFDTRPQWTIRPFGHFAIPRTVYVRTRDAFGTISTPYSDDIVYDPVPPRGSVRVESVDASSVQVTLSASDPDNLSGVSSMRVALEGAFDQAEWEPFDANKTLAREDGAEQVRVLAQFRDGAGNVSETYVAVGDDNPRPADLRLLLPLVRR